MADKNYGNGNNRISSFSWDTKPNPVPNYGRQIDIYDVGLDGSTWYSEGTKWILKSQPVFNSLASIPLTPAQMGICSFFVNGALYSCDGIGFYQNVKTVDNIAALIALSNMQTGNIVNVTSYYAGWAVTAAGPVGGGKFIYDSSKSGTNNGGTIINGWVRTADINEIHSSWFGAFGTNDSTSALRNFLNSASSNQKIVFDPGVYKLSNTDDSVLSIEGDSAYVLLLQNLSNICIEGYGAVLEQYGSLASFMYSFGIYNCSTVTMNGLSFDGKFQYTSATRLIYTRNQCVFIKCFNTTVSECNFKNSGSTALVISQQYTQTTSRKADHDTVKIINNHFDTVHGCSTFGAGVGDLIVSGNTFKDCVLAAFKLSSSTNSDSTVDGFSKVIITDNIFSTSSSYVNPLKPDGSSANVYRVGIASNSSAKNVIIKGNIFDCDGRGIAYTGILFDWASDYGNAANINYQNRGLVISNNQFANFTANSIGCLVNSYIGGSCNIKNNIFDTAYSGVSVQSLVALTAFDGKTNYSVVGNKFVNLIGNDITVSNLIAKQLILVGNQSSLSGNISDGYFFQMFTNNVIDDLDISGNTLHKGVQSVASMVTNCYVKNNNIILKSANIFALELINTSIPANSTVEIKNNSLLAGNQIYLQRFTNAYVENNNVANLTSAYWLDMYSLTNAYISGNAIPASRIRFDVNCTVSGDYKGTGAPTLALANGSTYKRSDGASTNDNFYVRRGASWAGIA